MNKKHFQTILSCLFLFAQMRVEADCPPSCDTKELEKNFSFGAEYLFWKVEDSSDPVPLVIEGAPNAVPSPVLGSPNTSVVLGGKDVDLGWRSGGRFNLGYQFGSTHNWSLNLAYFFLPQESKKSSVSSNGSPALLVPFYNVATLAEDSVTIANSLQNMTGTAKIVLSNHMQGVELNAGRAIPFFDCRFRWVGLFGFRYWNFVEHWTFSTNSPLLLESTDVYLTKDKFKTTNNFYGPQLGLEWKYLYRCFSLSVKGKVALGAMCEKLKISGRLDTNDYNGFGTVLSYTGGYFALPTNSGTTTQVKFSVIPEVYADLSYQVWHWMQLKVGYSFLYVSNLLWAGNQVNREINPSQAKTYTNGADPALVGPASPKASLHTSSLWVQGMNIGVEFSF